MVPNVKTDRLDDDRPLSSLDNTARSLSAARDEFIESPARRLQLELERTWAGAEATERWSARRSLAFIVLTNGLLWTALIWGVTRIV